MAEDDEPYSPFHYEVLQITDATSENADPLAYEKLPGVKDCPQCSPKSQAPVKGPKHVHMTVFFDGTKNHMLRDGTAATNVVRLLDLHNVGWNGNIYEAALYLRGVGPWDDKVFSEDAGKRHSEMMANADKRIADLKGLDGEAAAAMTRQRERLEAEAAEAARSQASEASGVLSWLYDAAVKAKAAVSEYTDRIVQKVTLRNMMRGSAFGYGIPARLNAARAWVTATAGKALLRNGVLHTADIRVNAVGFSRGATTAGAFFNICHDEVLPPLSQRFNVYFPFLGLFDTVASYGATGIALINARLSKTVADAELDLVLHADKRNRLGTSVFHATAIDEFRLNFRLTPTDCGTVRAYTGAHSDVGGGYPDAGLADISGESQGRSNRLANIALVDMWQAAYDAGVPLSSLNAKALLTIQASGGGGQADDYFLPAEDLRDLAAQFGSSHHRHAIWNMAYAYSIDRTRPQLKSRHEDQVLRDWYVKYNGLDQQCLADPNSVFLSEDFRSFRKQYNFWKTYIHVPYWFFTRDKDNTEAYNHSAVDAIEGATGYPFDGDIDLFRFERKTAVAD